LLQDSLSIKKSGAGHQMQQVWWPCASRSPADTGMRGFGLERTRGGLKQNGGFNESLMEFLGD